CQNWFHASCVEASLGPVVPFITNYKFLCKTCVVKPTGKNQNQQPAREPGSIPEFFERVTAGWKEICATTIANLVVQEYLKEAREYKGTERDPNEENLWSVNAHLINWNDHRYYFNKKDHILPYVDRHWKALCTDRSRTPTWWATLGSCLYISKDVFAATEEQARSASSDFCLAKPDLWNIKPGHITSHQSPSSRSQTPKGPREGKRKAVGPTGGPEELITKKSSLGSKSEKKSKSSSANRRTGTPPVISQTTYIPLPNTVVTTNSGSNMTSFSTPNEHPYNRFRFRYVPCEPDPSLEYMLYRQTVNPVLSGVRLCREDMSPYMFIDEECMTITTEKGFRMVRANCGVREGKWFYEVTIDRGGEPRYEGKDGAHVRLGWARREATLQAPVGFDAYSYGIRDTTGEKVHMSRVIPFGEPFETGDVIGLYISLPPDGNEKAFFKHRRLRKSFMFKGQLYFESVDYSPTKRYIEMAEYEATPIKTNLEKPVSPPIIPGSKIIVYKNGVCQGVMWQDLLALLPIEQNAKEKDQLRFDDGTLGYYPVISVYRNGTATANFGPNFRYPPSADPEAEAENKKQTASKNVWQPMSDRWEEKLVEECLIDLVDEVELWENQMHLKASVNAAGEAASESRIRSRDHTEEIDDSEMSSSGHQRTSSRSRGEHRSHGLKDEEDFGDIEMDSGVDRDPRGDEDPYDDEADRQSTQTGAHEHEEDFGYRSGDVVMEEDDETERRHVDDDSVLGREDNGRDSGDDGGEEDEDVDDEGSEAAYYDAR
ncbi:hypothetical protein BGW38_005125, partial [Lunasporangiospora selenospora]